jgi:nucleoside-diphosphate-sugar epimerase
MTKKAYVQAVGAAVGKRPWLLLPGRLTSIAGKRSEVLTRSQRVRNTKFEEATGWSPRYPSAREGWLAREPIHA